MVPQNPQQLSKHKYQGFPPNFSSSSVPPELHSKMNELVTSKTSEQSALSRYLHQVMRVTVATISQEIGWNTAHLSALDVLSDITVRYLLQVAKQSKKYTEHYGRSAVSLDDVALGFKDMHVSIPELEEYVQNFEKLEIPNELPYFPTPRKTEFNFLRPGSSEVLTRPVHVHEYLPPMIFEQTKEGELCKVSERKSTEEANLEETWVKQSDLDEVEKEPNGTRTMLPLVLEESTQITEVASELLIEDNNQPIVVTEEVEVKTENIASEVMQLGDENLLTPLTTSQIVPNDLEESSDDEIEPYTTKYALETASENAALKRVRKLLEEQGHPLREVTSVIMTSSGFLSESREGRLPECRVPSCRDFFESTSPPDVKKKIPTMKKLLEGVKKLGTAGEDSPDFENDTNRSVLPGTVDKIDPSGISSIGEGASHGPEEPQVVPESTGNENVGKRLSKQEKKLLKKKTKKELKAILKKQKTRLKERSLVKQSHQVSATPKVLEADDTGAVRNKLTIFTKKLKPEKLTGSSSSKKKKEKRNRLKLKTVKLPAQPVDEVTTVERANPDLSSVDGGENFSKPDVGYLPSLPQNLPTDKLEVSQTHVPKKRTKEEAAGRAQAKLFPLDSGASKQLLKSEKHAISPGLPGIPKAKISKYFKVPVEVAAQTPTPPIAMKKKRGRPKKVLPDAACTSLPATPSGMMSLPQAQLASIGKSLMVKEPTLKSEPTMLNVAKLRKDHNVATEMPKVKQALTCNPPTISPNTSSASSMVTADLLKRLPAQPGLIPDRTMLKNLTYPHVMPPQADIGSSSRTFSGSLPSSVCSSVTITRIDMNHQQKLPSPYDDSITPGIGLPPGMEVASKRSKLVKGVPPPPPLQMPLPLPIQTETESGITITPILMNSGGHNEHRFDNLPPPPPLQERPPQKNSTLARLDEELSSASSSTSSKERRKKDKEKRKELRKEKKKTKDKTRSKEKSEKKKKKKFKSGDKPVEPTNEFPQISASLGVIPKLTLKLGGPSNTPTQADSPTTPQVLHEPVAAMTVPPKKLTFKGIVQQEVPLQPPAMPKLKALPQIHQGVEDLEVARFAPLVTRPQKPARAAKTHAAAAVAAVAMGASLGSHQDLPQFLHTRGDATDASGAGSSYNKRGRGRPPKGGLNETPSKSSAPSTPTAPKQTKSLTVLETETVGCIIDEQGNKIWICPACGRQDDGSPMIGCDICDDWYHFTCVGITEEPPEGEPWYCQRCLKKQKTEGKLKKRK